MNEQLNLSTEVVVGGVYERTQQDGSTGWIVKAGREYEYVDFDGWEVELQSLQETADGEIVFNMVLNLDSFDREESKGRANCKRVVFIRKEGARTLEKHTEFIFDDQIHEPKIVGIGHKQEFFESEIALINRGGRAGYTLGLVDGRNYWPLEQ